MDWKLILQIAGVVLGLLYLWLEYRADIRLWIVGLVMPLVHGALYYKAGLYADCSMQVYYVLAGLYGWLVWRNAPRKSPRRPGTRQRQDRPIKRPEAKHSRGDTTANRTGTQRRDIATKRPAMQDPKRPKQPGAQNPPPSGSGIRPCAMQQD